jgi:carbonic anhydrase/acetyltransferase-like protein (isoleucine patch superfamily)
MSVTILPFGGIAPRIAADAFIAPGTRVIGNVQVGALASIWYNCVLRGDIGKISIGARTNVQDGTVIHVTGGVWDTDIGEDVLIGHLAMLHGCKLHNFSFVGLGSIVMDGCEIESQGMLAAGAMLTPGKRITAGQMWAGRPAKYVRDLFPEETARHREGVASYVENARQHAAALDSAAKLSAVR